MKNNLELLNDFKNNVIEQLNQAVEKNKPEAYDKAVELIKKAEAEGGRVHITGIGKPGHIAGYAASLFSSTGTKTYFLDGTEAIHGSLGQVDVKDVIIAISNSGNTEELLKTLNAAKNLGIKIISVTGNENFKIAAISDVALTATCSNEGDSLGKPPRASIINEIFVLQFLSLRLQNEKNLDMESYGKWHPAGAIGESIYGK